VPVAGDVDTVLAVDEVEIVVNLTVPVAHAQVATAALRAGKHVYGEKPFTATPADDAAHGGLDGRGARRVLRAPHPLQRLDRPPAVGLRPAQGR
ncbi:hypothetical protein E1265_22195, partial [Streptomyces sp. 8K308]